MSFVIDLGLTFVTVLLMQEEDIKGIWSMHQKSGKTNFINTKMCLRQDFAHAEVETVVERFFEKI